jgi:hypothetical protein
MPYDCAELCSERPGEPHLIDWGSLLTIPAVKWRDARFLEESFASQRVHGIDCRGASGGHQTGECRYGKQQKGSGQQNEGACRTALSPLRNQAVHREAQSKTRDDAQTDADSRRREDDLEHMTPLGTERHSDPEFVGSLDNGIGNNTVEADGGQDEREDRKSGEQDRNETFPCNNRLLLIQDSRMPSSQRVACWSGFTATICCLML